MVYLAEKTFKKNETKFTMNDVFFIGYIKSLTIRQLEDLNFKIKKIINFKKKQKINKLKAIN